MTLPRFHKSCAERAAETAGYFFKCPLCNNKEVFETEMKKFGVSSKPRPLVCRDSVWRVKAGRGENPLVQNSNIPPPKLS